MNAEMDFVRWRVTHYMAMWDAAISRNVHVRIAKRQINFVELNEQDFLNLDANGGI